MNKRIRISSLWIRKYPSKSMVGLWKKDQESCGVHAKARALVPKGRALRSHAPAECLQQGNLAFRDAIRPKTMRTHPNMCPIGPGPTRLAARQMLLPSERSCFPKRGLQLLPVAAAQVCGRAALRAWSAVLLSFAVPALPVDHGHGCMCAHAQKGTWAQLHGSWLRVRWLEAGFVVSAGGDELAVPHCPCRRDGFSVRHQDSNGSTFSRAIMTVVRRKASDTVNACLRP